MNHGVRVAVVADDGRGFEVRLWSRAHPGGLGIFDDDWLNTEIVVHGGAPWRYQAFLRAGDVVAFAGQMAEVVAGRAREAAFAPRDPWLAVQANVEPAGVRLDVFAHEFDSERQRRFAITITRDAFAVAAEGFARLAAAFPVRGGLR